MKKRTLIMIAALLTVVVLSLASCGLISSLGGSSSGGDAGSFSGSYEAINGYPRVKVSFSGSKVTVSVGTRSMSGSYTAVAGDDGTTDVTFDFGDNTLPRCDIRTGTYPVSVGEQNGEEYMMIFGSRYNKTK